MYDVAAQLKELDEEGPGGSKGKKTPIYKVQPKETLKGHKVCMALLAMQGKTMGCK